MKKIVLILGILLGVSTVICKAQNIASAIDRLSAREVAVVKNTTNEVADSSFVIIDMGSYRSFAIDIKMLGGVTVSAYTTLDETLAETSCGGWIPSTTEFFTKADGTSMTLTDSHILTWCGSKFSPVKIMLKFLNSDNTNSCKVITAKYN